MMSKPVVSLVLQLIRSMTVMLAMVKHVINILILTIKPLVLIMFGGWLLIKALILILLILMSNH
ncbi:MULTISPECIES: hypothetical protein [Leuconostoc gelidum group]|nr:MULTISPECIES: hypothetical protein [Leuconostoc gelidum group]MBZ5944926.1 hypothetical protein [Leuconostoc gasicomitatum]MBZ5945813.1 hypothetical protein [Leuconostoc gasicomitatum]MBZ5949821.1 hypothetical protein [Leuconostoc gasicomitatum]MBZ5953215.1 hypothetical protein [Leuconostoc gasicomitatum]MBZ5968522.1 hypothetical protein [Leuconostoc gasicomitatum]